MRQKIDCLAVRICAAVFFILISGTLFAQTRVTGNVKNAKDNSPVAFATVTVKGTTVATTTSTTGDFTINVPSGKTTLVISSVGFDDAEVPIGSGTVAVTLKEKVGSLDEIVVTGYTAQKKKEITGSVSVVDIKAMKSVPAGNPENMLQGQAAGLNVVTSGNPGDNSSILIRGITSFAGASPLIVVDGVPSAPQDLSTLHDLSASDIESVQILKDAQAAIYGARGSNGVILITTKKGKQGKATITYDGYYGTQRPLEGNVWNNLNTQGMADLYFLAAKNSQQVDANGNVVSAQYGTGQTPVIPDYILAGSKSGVSASDPAVDPSLYNIDYAKGDIYQIVAANKTGTDWYHTVFSPAPVQSHAITASGGNEKSTYLMSVNYFDQQGTLLNTYLKRYAARINTSFNVKNTIRVGENLYVYYKENPRITNNVEGNEVLETGWEQPIIPPYDIMGGFAGNRGNELGNSGSPLAQRVRSADNKGYDWAAQGNVWGELDFLKHFTLRTSFGGNIDNYSFFSHGYHTYEDKENNSSNSYGEGSGHFAAWTWTNSIVYKNVFAQKHSVSVFAGYEASQYTNREVGGNRINYFSDDPNYLSLSTGDPSGQTNYSFHNKNTVLSWLARIDYAYNDLIFLGLNGRRDGNSKFGPETRYGNFGGASLGVMLTKFDFMKSIDFLNSLKVRGSYGILGSSSNVPNNNAFTTYASGPGTSFYSITGSSTATALGFAYNTFGNLSTKWEGDKIINVGLDATVLKNSLDFTIEWYEKKINGLLFQDQPPAVVGYPLSNSYPFVNIGDMKNTGVDFQGTYHGKVGKNFTFNIGANITTYKNTVVSIPGSAGFFDVAYTHNTGPMVRNETGHPVGAFYGYQIVGIYQDAKDVENSPVETDALPGRYKYLDVDHNDTINDADRVFYGDPNPKFTYGINLSASWKQFDFSMVLYGSEGNDILNYTRYFQDWYPQFQNAKSQILLTNTWIPADRSLPRDQWTASNPGATLPIVENNSYFSTNAVLNNEFMEKGSYLRCKQLQIGYTLAPNVLSKLHIDRARIYVQAANLFTITNYTGLDPEIGTYSSSPYDNSSFGIDWGNYPTGQKTYLVGVNLSF